MLSILTGKTDGSTEMLVGHTPYRKQMALQHREKGVVYTISYFRSPEDAERFVRMIAGWLHWTQREISTALSIVRADHAKWLAEQEAK